MKSAERDGERLERLRNSPSSEEAVRFDNELGCERLRPQLLGLMATLGPLARAPAAAEVSNGVSPDTKATSEVARLAAPSPATEVAPSTPDEICKRDEERLDRLRSNPSGDEAARFANELGCEKLRPHLLGLMETFGYSAPAPPAAEVSDGVSPNAQAPSEAARLTAPSPGPDLANASAVVAGNAAAPPPAQTSAPDNSVRGVSDKESPDAKAASEAARPATPSPGSEAAPSAPDEICKRDEERLVRLRNSPSSDEVARFANELRCATLRPQLLRLMESLGSAATTPAAAEAPNGASPDAKAAREAVGPAPPSPGRDVANASAVVAGNGAAPPPALTSAPDNAVRGVSDKESPDAKAASDAARPAPPSPGPDVANVTAVAAAPLPGPTSATQENAARGVTNKEIAFGMAAPFSGASRELGRQIKIGVETAFSQINDAGGVNGRLLRLVSADDGYEPTRTANAMQVLCDKDHVFGFIGNVGTPTAAVALPFALDHRALFFGAFSGANLLRRDPPDRYVFNYRASYAEETDAVVHYLVKVRRIQPKEIVVFAQQDSYGDSGYAGVQKAVRSLPGDNPDIVRLNYKRNTVDVQDAVNGLRAFKGQIKAVVMVASYRAAAKFIEKTRDLYPSLIYTNVSFVGSTALADELTLLGPRYAAGVIVTQVVPAINS